VWEFLVGIIDFILLFFRTMFSPSSTSRGNQHQSDYRSGFRGNGPGGGGPGGGGPQRRIGRVGGGGGGPNCPPMAGGG